MYTIRIYLFKSIFAADDVAVIAATVPSFTFCLGVSNAFLLIILFLFSFGILRVLQLKMKCAPFKKLAASKQKQNDLFKLGFSTPKFNWIKNEYFFLFS